MDSSQTAYTGTRDPEPISAGAERRSCVWPLSDGFDGVAFNSGILRDDAKFLIAVVVRRTPRRRRGERSPSRRAVVGKAVLGASGTIVVVRSMVDPGVQVRRRQP
jgi:hypothetical protein